MYIPLSPVHKWLERKTGLYGSALTQAALTEYQLEKVRSTIEYARKNSRFYGERLRQIDVNAIRALKDMQKLPFTTVDDIRADANAFACISQNEIEKITTLSSSGTTGNPKRIFFSLSDLEIMTEFFAVGMSSMVEAGEKVMILMPHTATWSIGDILAKGLTRIGVQSVKYGPVMDYADAIRTAKATRVTNMVGIPSQVCQMAKLDAGLRPKTVLLSADYVPEAVVRTIEQSWKCEVFNHYGLTESGLAGGVECHAHEGYHMRDGDMLFEVIDPVTGEQAALGEYGEVVFTTLNRTAMPLIRFRTGDISRVLTGVCKCGSNINRLDKVKGRWANTIKLDSARTISIHELDELMLGMEQVLDYRAQLKSQNGNRELLLFIKSKAMLDAEHIKSAIKHHFDLNSSVFCGDGFFTKGTLKRGIEILSN